MKIKINNIFLSFMIMLCYGCIDIDTNKKKEIYVVYDDSWVNFGAKQDPRYEDEIKKEGYELVIKYLPVANLLSKRVYRSPSNRRYWFIGKFLIDQDKNISFVAVTSSKNFDEKKYKEEDIKDIKSSCRIANSKAKNVKKRYNLYHYYDLKEKKMMVLTEDNPKYDDYIIFGFARDMPQYLVIKNDYGKRLMENGTILPDPNELKDNIVWQDWYNYWGLTDYKIEIP